MDSYSTLTIETERELVVRRSRFIATAAPVENYRAALDFVAAIRAKYSDATHNCYAFISDNKGLEFKFSDDKEPAGTAGVPILEVLKKSGLFCTAIVVTRYFGGVKLGAAGLASAYASSAANVLSAARKVEMIYSVWLSVTVDYSAKGKLDSVVNRALGEIVSIEYGGEVTAVIVVPKDGADTLIGGIADITSGKAKITTINSGYYPYSNIRGGL